MRISQDWDSIFGGSHEKDYGILLGSIHKSPVFKENPRIVAKG